MKRIHVSTNIRWMEELDILKHVYRQCAVNLSLSLSLSLVLLFVFLIGKIHFKRQRISAGKHTLR